MLEDTGHIPVAYCHTSKGRDRDRVVSEGKMGEPFSRAVATDGYRPIGVGKEELPTTFRILVVNQHLIRN